MNCENCLNALEAGDKKLCQACNAGLCDGCSFIDPWADLTPDYSRTDGTWFCEECRVSPDNYDPQFDDRLEDERTGN